MENKINSAIVRLVLKFSQKKKLKTLCIPTHLLVYTRDSQNTTSCNRTTTGSLFFFLGDNFSVPLKKNKNKI